MAKRCAKCKYKLEEICRFWQVWRREVKLHDCSQKAVDRAREAGALVYRPMGITGGTQVLKPGVAKKIWDEEFPLNKSGSHDV